ncbi:MAG TPA: hypothetical protein VGH91_04610 [Gammaproteobacteria bacterium]|jgi:hypothetical protein
MTVTVLAFMQNQWFRDPERVEKLLASGIIKNRRDFIRRALFAGCQSGRTLRAVFGKELCQQMIWEEASPRIGGYASSKYEPDPAHIMKAIVEVNPVVVIAFGVVARRGLEGIRQDVIYAPHPAARHATARAELADARDRLLLRMQRRGTPRQKHAGVIV